VWEQAPNAALFGRDKSWKPHTIVVSLSPPRYDPGETTLAFNATILSRHVDRDPWAKEEEEEEAAAAAEGEEAANDASSSSATTANGLIGAGGTRGVGKARKTERERAGTDEHGAAGGLAAQAEATSAAAAAAGKRKHSFDLVNSDKSSSSSSSFSSTSFLHSKSSRTVTKSTKDKQKAVEEAEKKKKELIDLAEYTKDERRQQKKKALEKPPELELKGDAVALFVDDFSASVVPMVGFSGSNCLLPPGCLSANVCGWCPGRGGGLVGGGFGGGGFGGFG